MKNVIIAASLGFLLTACSKPTDTVIPADKALWEKELAPATQKLSEEDRKLFGAYMARSIMSGALGGSKEGIPFGTTIGQAIEAQKQWQAEQDRQAAEAAALKAKMEAERLETIKAINAAATVTLLSKKEMGSNIYERRFSDYQQFTIGVENKSEKEIVGLSGELEFIDVFDKVVGGVTFGISEKIKPGANFKWVGGRDYNQFNKAHKAVWGLEDGKYTTRFIPESIIFADGTKLKTPE